MIKVKKRNGELVDFQRSKIETAIQRAMLETKRGIEVSVAKEISRDIYQTLEDDEIIYDVEDIQDLVEVLLMRYRPDVAKVYILYRDKKAKERVTKEPSQGLLTEDFISKYKHLDSPMDQLGSFVYYRTYSRWLPNEKRREYWYETVRRAIEYNASLAPTTREEAESLFDNMFHLRQFLSGRTMWTGGTGVSKDYGMSNFNCSFIAIDSFQAFEDLFYLLMVGSGVGFRVLEKDVAQLPKIKTNYDIIHEDYIPVRKADRKDHTGLEFLSNDMVRITVGDSKEGWMQSLGFLFSILSKREYRKVKTIIMNYDNVRPFGEILKTFGGRASGHGSLKNMFVKIEKVLRRAVVATNAADLLRLRPVDCLDIGNVIGENVVVGGTRRTSEIALFEKEDVEVLNAKSNLYQQVNGAWVVDENLLHRQMSNNSIFYTKKPTREEWKWQIEKMRYSGEPGFVNAEAAAKRRPNFQGVNPCGEILLDSKGLCNLTTLNVMGFVENGYLNYEELMAAQKLSARAGFRMTQVELELSHWNAVHQRDNLIGVSLTGWQDMVNATGMSAEEQAKTLIDLRRVAQKAAAAYASEIGVNPPLLSTTIKPEGTISQLPGVSSGLHYSHSPYYIRRVRVNAADPMVKVCEELGYPVLPEVGQDPKNPSTKVVEFPVRAPEGVTKYEVSALQQLENYKMFMKNYVDHNASITVHVRNDEWSDVEEWVWNEWDNIVALSFLSLDDSFYQLMPYEAISKEEYTRRLNEMKPFRPSLISKYEVEEVEIESNDASCDTGVCPIR